MDDDL